MFHCSRRGLHNNTKSLIVMEMLHKLEDKEDYTFPVLKIVTRPRQLCERARRSQTSST